MIFGPLNKVHHNQEVAGEAHLNNDIQLKIESVEIRLPALFIVRCTLVEYQRQSLFQTFDGELAKILIDRHPLRDGEIRQKILA